MKMSDFSLIFSIQFYFYSAIETLMVIAPLEASSRRERQPCRLTLSQFSSLECEREHMQLVTLEAQPVVMSRRDKVKHRKTGQVYHMYKVSIKLLAAAAWLMSPFRKVQQLRARSDVASRKRKNSKIGQ
ncbi:hypothetical protein ILYODFUR_006482 [Ilyodon furcidens]|uniref:Uncharacterized protein n=1 Tax=Ilyodon furcidens TaxID=33524 RepID=A0ABV0V3F3_9TELE